MPPSPYKGKEKKRREGKKGLQYSRQWKRMFETHLSGNQEDHGLRAARQNISSLHQNLQAGHGGKHHGRCR
jgi:hypothetical protein